MSETAIRNQLPHTMDEFRTLFAFGVDLAGSKGITLVSIQVASFGGLNLHVDTMPEVDVLADALGLGAADEEDTNYTRRGVVADVLALPVPANVYSGRR